jgi:hypothetical protein
MLIAGHVARHQPPPQPDSATRFGSARPCVYFNGGWLCVFDVISLCAEAMQKPIVNAAVELEFDTGGRNTLLLPYVGTAIPPSNRP